jgi:RNA polymerase sigma-70 factor, ECF subfamily
MPLSRRCGESGFDRVRRASSREKSEPESGGLRLTGEAALQSPCAIFGESQKGAAKQMDNAQVFVLLERIAKRDEQAFRTLYEAFSRKIYAYALNQVKNPSKAEEIVADTLYDVWRAPLAFRGDSQFSTWITGIARNKVLGTFRRDKRDADQDDIEDYDEQLESDDPSGFELLADKQRRDGVKHCLDKLPDDQRECMHLVFYEGYTLGEISELQNVPEGTLKTRLFRARERLRTCLRLLLEREGTRS